MKDAGVNSFVLERQKAVLFVGNLAPVKGPDILLEAWGELERGAGRIGGRPAGGISEQNAAHFRFSHSGFILLFAGDGPMRKALERQALELGVADSVIFLGSRPHEEVALWMNAADCLCLPSRSEGMPNVVLEALASGLPVVATDVGAVGEMLEGETAARIVPSDDAVSPAEAVGDVLNRDVDRRALAARHAGPSWRRQAEKILALMERGKARG